MVSTDIAYADIAILRNRIAFLSAGIIAVALLLGAFGSTAWIVAPIKRVTTLMREVSQGNVDLNLSRQEPTGRSRRNASVHLGFSNEYA